MVVFRVEKTKNYTVIGNYHFREKKMSLKAKGLLSLMLSLPEDWNFSAEGLATLSKDGRDGVNAALKELEKFGYLERKQLFSKAGKFTGYEYIVHEKPSTEKPSTENPTQLNTKELNTKELNTNKLTNIEEPKEELTERELDHIALIKDLFDSWSVSNYQFLFIYDLARNQIPYEPGITLEDYDIRIYDGLQKLAGKAKADGVKYIYRWLEKMIPISEF